MHLVSDKTQLVNRWAVEDAGKLAKTATQNPSLAIGHARFCLDVNRELVRQLACYVYQCIIMEEGSLSKYKFGFSRFTQRADDSNRDWSILERSLV